MTFGAPGQMHHDTKKQVGGRSRKSALTDLDCHMVHCIGIGLRRCSHSLGEISCHRCMLIIENRLRTALRAKVAPALWGFRLRLMVDLLACDPIL